MSISYRGVYLTPATSDYHACRLSDVSLYARHLYALFESSSYACPSSIALEMGAEKISYETLSGKVNLCAAGLQAMGAEPGDVIVFSMEKSIALIVGLLAGLKIGVKICVLPNAVSALRLRAIQQAMPIAFLVNASGISPDTQSGSSDVYTASPRTISYDYLMASGLHSGYMTVGAQAFRAAAQLVINYDPVRGLYPIEYTQAYFLKAISQLDDVLPAVSQANQKIVTAAAVTQPKFLLDLFYAFSRQLTCVLVDQVKGSVVSHEYSREIEIQGLRVSLNEVEYFAHQYPGVTCAKALFSTDGLELQVQFVWDFYPTLVSRCVTAADLMSPKNEADRLACRLFYFLAQHLWAELPLTTMVLLPE